MGYDHYHCTRGCDGAMHGDHCTWCGNRTLGCNYPQEELGPVDLFLVDVGWQEEKCRECGAEVTYLGDKTTPVPDAYDPHDDTLWPCLPTYVCTACLYMYQIQYRPEPENSPLAPVMYDESYWYNKWLADQEPF